MTRAKRDSDRRLDQMLQMMEDCPTGFGQPGPGAAPRSDRQQAR
jgi:hypothetical protein